MTVIFDLDGTLLNTIADLGEACNYALTVCGLPVHQPEEYPRLVGNGVRKLIERALPEDQRNEDTIDRVVKPFIAFYDKHNFCHTQPYEGIPELLTELRKRGCCTAVASNKYHTATQAIVRHFFPDMFDAVFGEREGVERKPHPQIVLDILTQIETQYGSTSTSDILYVGDSLVDRDTAKNAGIPFVACSWGFVPRDTLLAAGVDRIIDSPEQLLSFLP